MALKPLIWPEYPSYLDHHGLALILLNLPSGTHRRDARLLARAALRLCLTELLHVAHFKIVESPCGPLIEGITADIKVSLSYAGNKVLIGLSKGRSLGVDIVAVDHFPEIKSLSKLYLPVAPNADFALAWAQMEASCKALKLPLSEINDARKLAYASCELVDCEQMDGYRIALATTSS